jgi:hypothetical protein
MTNPNEPQDTSPPPDMDDTRDEQPSTPDEQAQAEGDSLADWGEMRGDRDTDPNAPNPHREA